jgi:uncharacterized membrane protein YesL
MKNDSGPTNRRGVSSVAIAFRTLGRVLRHGYDNLGTLAIVSVFWWIGVVLIIPVGAATAAAHRVLLPATEERSTNWRRFFDYLRTDFLWGSKLTLVLIGVAVLLQLNIRFYSASEQPVLQGVSILFVTLSLVWLGVMLYAFPIALRQQEQQFRMTLRNTIVMVLANLPGVLLSLLILALIGALFIIIPPLFVLLPGLVMLWGQENVRLLLVATGYLPEDEIADRPRR